MDDLREISTDDLPTQRGGEQYFERRAIQAAKKFGMEPTEELPTELVETDPAIEQRDSGEPHSPTLAEAHTVAPRSEVGIVRPESLVGFQEREALLLLAIGDPRIEGELRRHFSPDDISRAREKVYGRFRWAHNSTRPQLETTSVTPARNLPQLSPADKKILYEALAIKTINLSAQVENGTVDKDYLQQFQGLLDRPELIGSNPQREGIRVRARKFGQRVQIRAATALIRGTGGKIVPQAA